jgi:hypothetical protein
MPAVMTRVTNIQDAGGEGGTVHVASNRRPIVGGTKRAERVAAAALANLHPGARIVGVTYAGRDPSMRQATPYRYLVTFTRAGTP